MIFLLFSILLVSAAADSQSKPGGKSFVEPLQGIQDIICKDPYRDFSIELPFFPQLVASGVTVAANNIKIENLNKCDFDPGLFQQTYTNAHIRITSDPMILGGKLWNLPTTGRGKLQIDVYDMVIRINFFLKRLSPWGKNNPITIGRLKVHHDNLNPGQESGDLINDVLSMMKDEVANFLADKIQKLLEKLFPVPSYVKSGFGPPTEEDITRGMSVASLLNTSQVPDTWRSAYNMIMSPQETRNEDLENVLSLKKDVEHELELFIEGNFLNHY